MYIILTKVDDAPDFNQPNAVFKKINAIKNGFVKRGKFLNHPVVGKPFEIGYGYRTSTVQKIINENTFQTLNSIYEYELTEIKDVPLREYQIELLKAALYVYMVEVKNNDVSTQAQLLHSYLSKNL